MEVVACFLQKYFSLITNKDLQAVKELYSEKALVSVVVNGEAETSTGSSLVEKVGGIFAHSIVSINLVQVIDTTETVAFTASGTFFSNHANGLEATFTQKVTLFHSIKHWYIAAEQMDISIPEAVEEPVEEVEAAPEVEEEEVEEKVPEPVVAKAPQRSPAKAEVKEVEKTAVAPVVAEKEKTPAPTTAKPAGWAALAAAAPTHNAPKVQVNVATKPTAAAATPAAPVVKTPVVQQVVSGVHFTISPIGTGSKLEKEKDPAKIKDMVTSELFPQLTKVGINAKDDIKDIRMPIRDGKILVFIDFTIPDALEKMMSIQGLNIQGIRIYPTQQNKK